jgi:hypothetical protein
MCEFLDTITSWISTCGYPDAFFALILETIFPPIPSEFYIPTYRIYCTNYRFRIGEHNRNGYRRSLGFYSRFNRFSIAIYFVAL